jgi:hypothetical protein
MSEWIVTPECGPRPAGKPDECFYCRAAMGADHNIGCPFRCVPATAHIRRNSDGLVRQCRTDWSVDDPSDFIWSEGNYACDCNRYLFFQRAADEPDDDVVACGATAYTVLRIELNDGTVVYSES